MQYNSPAQPHHVAKLASATVLDKDTYAPGLKHAVMQWLTGDPHNRDHLH
ncbi:hypothetical protein [Nocardia sp. N2S4-5]